MKTIRLASFQGINNRLPRHGLGREGEEGARYLADAANVDVEEDGSLCRRDAARLVLPLAGAHSGFCWQGQAYVCQNNALFAINPATGDKTLLAYVQGRVSYAGFLGGVYFSDGVRLREIFQGKALPVTAPVPDAPKGNAPGAKNRHLVALTSLVGTLESAPSPIVPLGGGNILLPDAPAGVTHFGVYVSAADGEVLNLLDFFPATTRVVPIGVPVNKPLPFVGKDETPAGEIIRVANGRLFSARGNTLFWSETYNFGIYDPLANYVRFPAPVSVVEPCGAGMWIVADKAYFLSAPGSPDAALREALPYGAARFASAKGPEDGSVFWLSARGLCRGAEDGSAQNLTEKNLAENFSGTGALRVDNRRVVGVCDGL
ncbi:MAG: hypothetical protein LBU11_13280 [Zoogloeaceae bacterium]|jgi:hypothetical protein|nr:hypothetical protein [Zoogloeaceae bacterium]